MNEKLINYLNLDKPTNRQTVEVVRILIRSILNITDDGYHVSSLTGKKISKVKTEPTMIDDMTDEEIIRGLAAGETIKLIKPIQDNLLSLMEEIKKLKVKIK